MTPTSSEKAKPNLTESKFRPCGEPIFNVLIVKDLFKTMLCLIKFFEKITLHHHPLRVSLYRRFMREFPFTPYSYRASIDAVVRPQYAFCIIEAAKMAKDMGLEKISILEFGVAGGNGLVNIEGHVREVEKEFGIRCEIYGFDSSEGMPSSIDYRDILYTWGEGFYKMDRPALEHRLKTAKLIIGDVKNTARNFCAKYSPAPIGCVFFDVDYYSSTLAAFEIFNTASETRLPRVACHFDDISCTNEFLGELCAIKEFNSTHKKLKISPHHMLSEMRRVTMPWNKEIFFFHDFDHPQYNTCYRDNYQLPLEP